jgi:hypothetical protein
MVVDVVVIQLIVGYIMSAKSERQVRRYLAITLVQSAC